MIIKGCVQWDSLQLKRFHFQESGGAMVLGKLPVPGRPTIWIIVGQGPIALAVGAGGGLFGHFYSPLSFLFSFSLSLGDSPI